MLFFGQVGSSWGHSAFFGSTWGEKVITPNNLNIIRVMSLNVPRESILSRLARQILVMSVCRLSD
jgi:hypothetical protein